MANHRLAHVPTGKRFLLSGPCIFLVQSAKPLVIVCNSGYLEGQEFKGDGTCLIPLNSRKVSVQSNGETGVVVYDDTAVRLDD